MHAIIEVNGPGDVSIIDLGSTKGTFVNGQKVNKAKLQSGDTIVVGETRIELAIGAPARKPRTSRPASQRRRAARTSSRRRRARAAPPRAADDAAPPAPPPRRIRAAAASAPPPPRRPPRSAAARWRRRRSPPPAVRPPPGHVDARPRALRHRDRAGRRLPAGDGRSRPMTSAAPAPSRSPRCSATPSSA